MRRVKHMLGSGSDRMWAKTICEHLETAKLETSTHVALGFLLTFTPINLRDNNFSSALHQLSISYGDEADDI